MADIKPYFPKLLPDEAGYVKDPIDRGGATNMGVTLNTWRAMGYDKDGDGDIDENDIKLLTPDDAMMVLKVGFWDRWRADSIVNQSVAETLVEWVWGSGKWGIIIPQRILAVVDDGRVGVRTIAAVNQANQKWLHEKIRLAKLQYISDLIKAHPEQERFKNGWVRRINEYQFSE